MQREAKRRAKQGIVAKQAAPHARPVVRGDCAKGIRPCPFVGCRYHLFLDAKQNGALTMYYGEDVDALWDMRQTCALDVADDGSASMAEIGELFGLVDAAIKLVADQGMAKLANLRRVAENQ